MLTSLSPLAGQRLQHMLHRVLPDTVFGRLVLILATGMLAAQFLTSSIWLNVRYDHMLEAPTRVIAERMADAVVLLQTDAHGEQSLLQFTHPGFEAQLQAHAQVPVDPGWTRIKSWCAPPKRWWTASSSSDCHNSPRPP